MAYVKESLSDADLVLMMTDVFENPDEFADQEIFAQMRAAKRYTTRFVVFSKRSICVLKSTFDLGARCTGITHGLKACEWLILPLSYVPFFLSLHQHRPMLLAVNKVDVFPNATSKTGKLGKEMLAKVR